MLTPRFAQGLAMAIEAHAQQFRKGTTIPYVSHPMGVASIALEYGADEDQAIAALLHDAIEDGGPIYIDRIQSSFGDRVLQIVMGCTDGVPDASGQKGDWKQRKVAYINHLAEASDDVLLVSGSDKLHNARAIVSDMERIGDQVFERFTASKEQTIWYYSSLSQIFETRQAPMASSLNVVVQRMGNFG
jgi:(p)ppGpp synthase/HD superfamily hydrolase